METANMIESYSLGPNSGPNRVVLTANAGYVDMGLPQDVPCLVCANLPGGPIDLYLYNADGGSASIGIPITMSSTQYHGVHGVVVTRRAGVTAYCKADAGTTINLYVMELA